MVTKKGFTPLDNIINRQADKNNRRNFLRGFTIVEVLVAITIFGIGVLALLTYFAIATQFSRIARETTIATNLAQGLIEETIAQSYDSLTPATGARTPFSIDETSPYKNYQKQINIALINSSLAPSASDVGLKKVQVLIYWNTTKGEKNVEFATVVSQK